MSHNPGLVPAWHEIARREMPVAVKKWPILAGFNLLGGETQDKIFKILNAKRLLDLAEQAVVARLLVGVIRVVLNSPEHLNHNDLAPNDKKKTFLERLFVEMIGTPGYVFCINLAQEIGTKLSDLRYARQFEYFKGPYWDQLVEQGHLSLADGEKGKRVFQQICGESSVGVTRRFLSQENLIPRAIEDIKKGPRRLFRIKLNDARLVSLLEKEGSLLTVRGGARTFLDKVNQSGSNSIILSAVAGALFGGYVVQAFNDRLLSPVLAEIFPSNRKKNAPVNPGGILPNVPGLPASPSLQVQPVAVNPPQFSAQPPQADRFQRQATEGGAP
ncbi:MAG: hypothetical protein AB7P76_08930 [Candidatus Melainabacteria bacterium]